jgi:hypothetical protein
MTTTKQTQVKETALKILIRGVDSDGSRSSGVSFTDRIEKLRKEVQEKTPQTISMCDNWMDGFHNGAGPMQKQKGTTHA